MTARRGGFKRYMYYGAPPKRYEFSVVRYSRAEAGRIAENLRQRGYDARVESYGGEGMGIKFAVYKRKRGKP